MKQKKRKTLILAGIITSAFSADSRTYYQCPRSIRPDPVELKLSEGIRRYDYAYQVLDLVNKTRAEKNLSPVTMDKNLLECAMTRAEELTIYASHTRPNGYSCFSAFPYFAGVSENLAINQATPDDVMDSWINSSGHYANIMNSQNVSAGIGCYSQNGHLY